jgi:hypothetical protein
MQVAVLSPFDYTHIVLEGVVAHPEILANMSIGEGEWILAKNCEKPVAIDKDKVICDAEAGFSHTRFGVAVKKSVGGYLGVVQQVLMELRKCCLRICTWGTHRCLL